MGCAAFTIFGRLVVGLRKSGTQRRGGNIERIAGLFQEELPFLFRREGRCGRGCIVNRLIVGDDAHDAVMIQTIGAEAIGRLRVGGGAREQADQYRWHSDACEAGHWSRGVPLLHEVTRAGVSVRV